MNVSRLFHTAVEGEASKYFGFSDSGLLEVISHGF